MAIDTQQEPDVTKLSDDQLNQMIAQQQSSGNKTNQQPAINQPSADPSKLSDAELEMQINKLKGQPDSMANMGPVDYAKEHPFKTALQPASKTITGKSLEDFANDATSGRPDTGMDNPITYWSQTAKQAAATTAGSVADAFSTPANYAIGPLAKGVIGATAKGIEALPQGMRDASARLYDWMIRLPTKAFNYDKDPLDVLAQEKLPGNSITELARNAEDRLNVRSQELNDAVAKSNKTVNINEIINQHLDDAAGKAEGSLQDRTAMMTKLQTMGDKINEQYGNLYSLPIQKAIQLKRQLADDFPFTAGDAEGNMLAKTAHSMYHDINSAVEAAEPDIADLNHKVSGLIDISKAARNRMAVESRNNPIGIIATILGTGAGAAISGLSGAGEGMAAGVVTGIMAKAVSSPAVMTRVATTLSNMADVDKINLFKAAPWFMDIAQKASEFIKGGEKTPLLDAEVVGSDVKPNLGDQPGTKIIPNNQGSLTNQSIQPSGLIPKFMQEGIGKKPALEPRTGPKYPSTDPTINDQGLPLVNKSISLRGPSQSATTDLSTLPKTAPDNGRLQPNERAQFDMSKKGSDVASNTAMAVGASGLVPQKGDQDRFKLSSANYTKQEEGFRGDSYTDTKGHQTIGYGFNMDSPSVQRFIPEEVKNGSRSLTQNEADGIFTKVYNVAKNQAIQFTGNRTWDTMSPNQQKAITDMSYNLGSAKLSGFKHLKAALQSGNWSQASKEVLNSDYAKEVPNRARRNAILISRNQ